nr:MAG TPA: hypothetical protein [Caudoviricetes sp.]
MKTSDVLPTSTKHQVALSDKKRRVLMGASFWFIRLFRSTG